MDVAAEAFEQYLGDMMQMNISSLTLACLLLGFFLAFHCPLQPRSEWEPDHVDMDIDSGHLGLSGQCFLS